MSEKQDNLEKAIESLTKRPEFFDKSNEEKERIMTKFVTICALVSGLLFGIPLLEGMRLFVLLSVFIFLGIIVSLPFYFFVRKKGQETKEKFFAAQLVVIAIVLIYFVSEGWLGLVFDKDGL